MSGTQASILNNKSLRDVFFLASVAGAALLVAVSPDLAQGAPEAITGAVAGASLLGAGYSGLGQVGESTKAPEPGGQ